MQPNFSDGKRGIGAPRWRSARGVLAGVSRARRRARRIKRGKKFSLWEVSPRLGRDYTGTCWASGGVAQGQIASQAIVLVTGELTMRGAGWTLIVMAAVLHFCVCKWEYYKGESPYAKGM